MARRAAVAARTEAIASVPFEVLGAVVMAADAHIAKEPITCAYRKHEVFRYSTPATREDVLQLLEARVQVGSEPEPATSIDELRLAGAEPLQAQLATRLGTIPSGGSHDLCASCAQLMVRVTAAMCGLRARLQRQQRPCGCVGGPGAQRTG